MKALTTAASGAYERPIGIVQLDEADREFLRALALPAEDEKPRMQLNIAPFYRHKKSAETIMDPCAGKTIHRKLLVISIVARNRAFSEQAGKIVGVYGVAQEKRPGHMEDFLHGAQIRRVREKDRAGKRDAVHVGASLG